MSNIPSPAPGTTETWMWAACAVGGFVLILKQLFGRKPPLEAEFVSRVEHNEFKREVKDEFNAVKTSIQREFKSIGAQVEESKTALLMAGEKRAADIHERFNAMSTQVAALNERTKNL